MDDADVEVLDEEDDRGSAAVDAEADVALAHAVAADEELGAQGLVAGTSAVRREAEDRRHPASWSGRRGGVRLTSAWDQRWSMQPGRRCCRRSRSAQGQTDVSDQRDEIAAARDTAAGSHDDRADARDRRAEARERRTGGLDPSASADRAAARRDRRRGAVDRKCAQGDRVAARADRVHAADELASAAVDGLTGALRRDTGTVELEREAARATRASQRFIVAFIDVVGLKAVNDRLGHAAGDEVLRRTAAAIRGCLRSYDLLVRYGGDEFVCGLVDMPIDEAESRFGDVNAVLAAGGALVTVGLAELLPVETTAHLVARADADMYRQRGSTGSASRNRESS